MDYEKKYIDADLLRKEIERLKDEYTDIAIDSSRGWVNANYVIEDLEQLQLQIYSLQQEQPEVNLENEYKEYVEDDPVVSKLTNRNVGLAIARHFYELGKNSR